MVARLLGCVFVWLVDWLLGCEVAWLIGCVFVRLFDCLVGCVVVWLLDCLVGWQTSSN